MSAAGSRQVAYEPDDIDRQIIEILKEDGRATHQDIAAKLKIAAATVSSRIRRLEQANAMRVVAITDFAALGYRVLLAIGIEVEGRPARKVAEDLARLSEVFAVHLVTGARDIEILVALHDFDEIKNFLLSDLAKIRGMRNVEAAIAADVIKFDFDVAPIV